MAKGEGATPGAIMSATPGAIPCQRAVNGGATHTPYTPSVAPALGGWVLAPKGSQFQKFGTLSQCKIRTRQDNRNYALSMTRLKACDSYRVSKHALRARRHITRELLG